MSIQHELKIWTLAVVRRENTKPFELRTRALIGRDERELKDALVKYLMENLWNPDDMNKLTIDQIRETVKDYILIGPIAIQEIWFTDGIEVIDGQTTA